MSSLNAALGGSRSGLRPTVRTIFGLLVSGFFLWLAVHRVDLVAAWQALAAANLIPLLPAMAIAVAMLFVRGARWSVILAPVAPASWVALGWSTCVGFALDALLPARLGELARVWSASRRTGVPLAAVLGSAVVERLCDLLSVLALLLAGLWLWDLGTPLASVLASAPRGLATDVTGPQLTHRLAVAAAVLVTAVVVLRWQADAALRATRYLAGQLSERWGARRLEAAAQSLLKALSLRCSALELARIAGLSAALWLAASVVVVLVLAACHLPVSAPTVVLVLLATVLAVSLPSGPGAIGVYEFLAAGSIGVSTGAAWSEALAAAVLLHLTNVAPRLAVGLATLAAQELQRPTPAPGEPGQDEEAVAGPRARPDLSVVVPVFNNAETLVELAARVAAVAAGAGLSHELILVDDASRDGSAAVAARVAGERPEVGVIVLAANVGQHRAVMEGLTYTRGRWVVVMDADLQDPPEAIPDLLEKAHQGYDAVFAVRRGRYESVTRLITSRLFKTLLHHVAGVPRDAGMFMLLNRRLVSRLCASSPARPWVVAMVGLVGALIGSVPIRRHPRPVGVSGYSPGMRLWAGLRAIHFAVAWRWCGRHCATACTPAPVAARHGWCASESDAALGQRR